MKVKKGEYVTRKSYGNDIVFVVDRIINLKDGNALAILKGVTFRVEADAPLQDIEKVYESRVIKSKKEMEKECKAFFWQFCTARSMPFCTLRGILFHRLKYIEIILQK